uniref:Fatty acid hydroxylase domain-containing protein n=1 Tax=viral metagenome TaxID=1070528 RepID=A0A6C0D7X2_9ZZZZ
MFISYKSIKNFILVNSTLLSISFFEYYLSKSFLLTFISVMFKNYTMINIIDYQLKDKPYINDKYIEPKEKYYGEFSSYVVMSAIIEATSLKIIRYNTTKEDNIITDLVTFIPISFLFEIIFDFFHYITHSYLHTNKYLYKIIHKKHHKHFNLKSILTFYHHPLDIIITNTIPLFITIYLMPNISYFQLLIIMTYKTFIEISGHSGKKVNPGSFPQFIWLPKLFNMQLFTRNHNLHHTNVNCNYAKRFNLWDRLFGTNK